MTAPPTPLLLAAGTPSRHRRSHTPARNLPTFTELVTSYDTLHPDPDQLAATRDQLVEVLQSSTWLATSATGDLSELLAELKTVGDCASPYVDDPETYDPEQHWGSLVSAIYQLARNDEIVLTNHR